MAFKVADEQRKLQELSEKVIKEIDEKWRLWWLTNKENCKNSKTK